MTLHHRHLINLIYSSPWAIREEKLFAINEIMTRKIAGFSLSTEEIQAITKAAKPGRPARSQGDIAVLPVMGVISHRASLVSDVSGPTGTSAERLSADFQSLMEAPNVGTIVLDVNSPGGTVGGVPELAQQIYDARGKKRVIAVANAEIASAAYWIASAAQELVVTPSGEVGSIGVFMMHQDFSQAMDAAGVKTTFIKAGKFKAEGNPYEPLTDEAQSALQESVDNYYSMFIKAVARGRGASVSEVRNGFGQGRMVMADEAVRLGMADRVATLEQTLARLGAGAEVDVKILAGEGTPGVEASAEAEGTKEIELENRDAATMQAVDIGHLMRLIES